jgi:hypothetical protein
VTRLAAPQLLVLLEATAFDSGITLLCYRPTPDQQATPGT